MIDKSITECSIAEFVFSFGGSMDDDETPEAVGCCRFMAAVLKWYRMNSLTPLAIKTLAMDMPMEKANNLILLAEVCQHAFNELNNIVNIGLEGDSYPCEGGERLHNVKCKTDLTLVKK